MRVEPGPRLHATVYYLSAARSPVRGQAAVDDIKREVGLKAKVEFMPLDLASLASIRTFAQQFKESQRPLHALVLNAGVMMCPFNTTKDGFEMQIGTNHLGHFLLTHLLLVHPPLPHHEWITFGDPEPSALMSHFPHPRLQTEACPRRHGRDAKKQKRHSPSKKAFSHGLQTNNGQLPLEPKLVHN